MRYTPSFFSSRAFQLSLGSWMVAFLPCITILSVSIFALSTELWGGVRAIRFLPVILALTVPVTTLIVTAIVRDIDWILHGSYYVSGVSTYTLLLAISILNGYYLLVGIRRSLELGRPLVWFHGNPRGGEPDDALESPS
ncbi:hypothetical protein [Roseiconus lacunae]|uniref:Uncharacterized protein n=1 Tax=Roseiconus lacunae TaxID=2605694 RepID=A0ABT7PT14_9BACT|nr:hypothetical protein [Roseiconus lacunae]MDM4019414.1 hypothetical protein [Roseiconus lacunae]